MSGILAYLAAFLLYALIGWHFWRTRWNAPAKLAGGPVITAGWERYVILAPLVLHGYTLYDSIFAGAGLNFGVGSAVSSIVWLTAVIYWVSGFFYRLEGLQTLVAPVAAVAVLLPLVFPSLRPLANTELPAFKAHISIAMLAYSLLTIAALHALLMAVVEHRLHHPAMPTVMTNLPASSDNGNFAVPCHLGGIHTADADAHQWDRISRKKYSANRSNSLTRRYSASFPGVYSLRCWRVASFMAGADVSPSVGRLPDLLSCCSPISAANSCWK